RKNGIIAGLITNGYLLTAERIEKLNRAGLEWLQISIDNVTPDEVSKKSLKVLDKKLQLLAEYADFHVNINSVVGGGVRSPQDALVSWEPARAPTRHRHSPGIQHREIMRAALHGVLRTPGIDFRFVARPAISRD